MRECFSDNLKETLLGKKLLFFSVMMFIFLFCFISGLQEKEEEKSIEVFCGSVFKPAIEEIIPEFTRQTGIGVNLHIGSSGAMLSQIEISKRGDLYISGSPDFMIKAEKKGIVKKNDYTAIAWLIPAIAVPSRNSAKIRNLSDLAKPGLKILIANPESVCLGVYAVELLKKNGLYEKVKPNIITYSESCAKTASLVAMDTVDAAIGWSVFKKWNPERMSIIPLKKEEISRIAFIPVSVINYSSKKELSLEFIKFLQNDFTGNILYKWGFYSNADDARRDAPFADIGGEYNPGIY